MKIPIWRRKKLDIEVEKDTSELSEEEILLRAKDIMQKNEQKEADVKQEEKEQQQKHEAKDDNIELNDMSTYKLTVVNLLAAILEEIKKLRD